MPTDLYWTLDSDISVGRNGDLRDTSFDPLRSYIQEVRTRVMSSLNDWAIHKSLGARLDELIGRPNNRMTAEEGKNQIIASLVYGGFLKKDSIKVRYIPIAKDQLAYFINVTVVVPETGRIQSFDVQILYDTREGDLRMF